MAKSNPHESENSSDGRERYSIGYQAIGQRMARRSFAREGAFFLPYVETGMNVLDCGCGNGAITYGIAEAVNPGTVVGIDIGEEQIEYANNGVPDNVRSNLRFEVGSAYELPFPDESFDAVFSHNMLEHLGDPLKAIAEMKRVLKVGGVIGCRAAIHQGSDVIEPAEEIVEKFLHLYERLSKENGGSPGIGRHLKGLFRTLGFTDIGYSIAYEPVVSNSEDARKTADAMISDSSIRDQMSARGWWTDEDSELLEQFWHRFAEHLDAFWVRSRGEVVGRKE